MKNAYADLLAANLDPEPFIRRALGLLEADFRAVALRALADWQSVGLVSGELFPAVVSLQRPSFGSWNGLLAALRNARKAARRSAGPGERARLEGATTLDRLLALLDESVEPALAAALKPLGELAHTKVGSKAKLGQVLALPIALRNRVAHDSPTEPAWWASAASALRPLVQLHADAAPLAPFDALPEPWFLVEGGETLAFNGVTSDFSVVYVSPGGVSRTTGERTRAVLLAFEQLLGKTEQRERDIRALLAKLAPEEIKGVVLGDYLLGRPVGQGGFATVHVGRQLSTGRKVALKVLHDGLAEDARARFQQEAAFLSRLDHPGIVRVLGHGEETWSPPRLPVLAEEEWFRTFARSAPVKTFMALEWIEGETLDAVWRRGKQAGPGARGLASWFAQAASALAAVHAAGLIHRDVKPANLMVTGEGVVKLMDFGIARTQGENRTLATETGAALGTPSYMSPEQIRSADAEAGVGPATDVYSLAATFYELFTGKRLFDHDRENAKAVETQKLEGRRPERPRIHAREIGWDLETILMGGLEPEVADRYSSATALERDLRHFLRDEPIEYRRPSLARRLHLGYRRNRTLAHVVAGFLALLLAGTTYYIESLRAKEARALAGESLARTQADEARKAQRRAEAAEAAATEERDRAALSAFDARTRLVEAQLAKLWDRRERERLEHPGPLVREAAQVCSAARAEERRAPDLARAPAALRAEAARIASRVACVEQSARTVAALAAAPLLVKGILGSTYQLGCVAVSPDGEEILAGDESGALALWERATGRPVRVLEGHDANVVAIAFSTDGRAIASASLDGTLRVWARASGRLERTIEGRDRSESPSWVSFSPDGARLVSAWPESVRVHDRASGALVRTLGDCTPSACALSPDGASVLVGSTGGLVLRDLASGETLREFEGQKGQVLCCAFSKDGRQILSGSDDKKLRLWNREGELLVAIEHADRVTACAFAPGGAVASVAPLADWKDALADPGLSGETALQLRDPATGALRRAFRGESFAFSPDGAAVVLVVNGDLEVRGRESGERLRSFVAGRAHAVLACAVSPDGVELLAGSDDGTLRLWDRASERLLRRSPGHGKPVNAVAFSPDGSELLSASDDGTIELRERATGKLLRTLAGHAGPVRAAAFSPDGTAVLSASDDHTLRLWDRASGALVRTLEGHAAEVVACAFSIDGSEIVSGSRDRTARLWSRETGRVVRTLEHAGPITAIALSPDGKLLATAASEGPSVALRVFDRASGRPLLLVDAGNPQLFKVESRALAFSPDGRDLLSAAHALEVRDRVSGRVLRRLPTVGSRACAFSPDGLELVSAEGGTVQLRERGGLCRSFEGHQMDRSLNEPTPAAYACAFAPDGLEILSAGQDHTLRLWDRRSGRLVRVFEHASAVTACAFSPDGRAILSGSSDGKLLLRDRATGILVRDFAGHKNAIDACVFSPDGREILSASLDGTLRLWDRATGAPVRSFESLGDAPTACAFSPDGREVAASGRTLRFWDRASGRLLRSFGSALAFAFAPEGDEIVLAVGAGLELRDRRTGELIRAFERRASPISRSLSPGETTVAFSPDGALVASGGDDGTLRLWDRASGRLLESFQAPGTSTPRVNGAAFSPDGAEVLAALEDGTLQLWTARPAHGRALFRDLASEGSVRRELDALGTSPLPALETDEAWTAPELRSADELGARGLRLLLGGGASPAGGSSGRAYLRAAAEAGSLRAATRLAWALERGLGGPREKEEAARWRERAAKGGDPLALGRLDEAAAQGDLLAATLLAVARKDEQALRVAAERREPDALRALASLRPGEAPALLAVACALDDPGALAIVGESHIAADPVAARRDLERAALGGEPQAWAALARIYDEGLGVERDPEKAAELRARAR